jgi:DNA-binding transcriptional MerR regulator
MVADTGSIDARQRSAKSPDAFRTISEVATELDVPQHVLRFWESKFNQIKPMKRGGGRRYYRPDDVLLLRGIRRLLYEDGYTIKGVQKVLRERGVRAVLEAVRESPQDAAGLAAMVHESSVAELQQAPTDDLRGRIRSIISELEDIRQSLAD